MYRDVEVALEKIRKDLQARGSDIELLRTTELGIVQVRLYGECCSGKLRHLMTIIDIEDTLKGQVPGVKVVTDMGQHFTT